MSAALTDRPVDVLDLQLILSCAISDCVHQEHGWLVNKDLTYPVLVDPAMSIMLPMIRPGGGGFVKNIESAIVVGRDGEHSFWGAPSLPYRGLVHRMGVFREGGAVWLVEQLDDAVALLLASRALYRRDEVWLCGDSENLLAVAAKAPRTAVVIARNDPEGCSAKTAGQTGLRWSVPIMGSAFELYRTNQGDLRKLMLSMV